MKALTMLGLGAGLMYFLDPDRGRRRRALVRDQVDHLLHEVDHAIEVTTHDLSNRSRGLMAEAEHMFTPDNASDRVIVERVRSAMGRVVSHPRAISVTSIQGHVTLRGPILAVEVEPLFHKVQSVRGVQGVNNLLEIYENPGDVPALQGGHIRTGERSEFLQENWSPTAKLLAGTACGALLFSAAGRGSIARLGVGAIGIGLAARALTQATGTNPLHALKDQLEPAFSRQ